MGSLHHIDRTGDKNSPKVLGYLGDILVYTYCPYIHRSFVLKPSRDVVFHRT